MFSKDDLKAEYICPLLADSIFVRTVQYKLPTTDDDILWNAHHCLDEVTRLLVDNTKKRKKSAGSQSSRVGKKR